MKYYLIAGEASGDLHASNLMRGLQACDPACEIRFWGGDAMAAVGGTQVRSYGDTAMMGYTDVLLKARKVLGGLAFCKKDILAWKPDVVILIDYPGFNFKIARFAHVRPKRTRALINLRIRRAQILVADQAADVLRRRLDLAHLIIKRAHAENRHGVRHIPDGVPFRHHRLVVQLRRLPKQRPLVFRVPGQAVDPRQFQIHACTVRQRRADHFRVVDRQLVRSPRLRHAPRLRALEIHMLRLQEFRDRFLVPRRQRRHERLLVRRVAAVLADPDRVKVRIEPLVMRAKIHVRLLRDHPRTRLRHPRFRAANRARLLHNESKSFRQSNHPRRGKPRFLPNYNGK